jgi:3-deoxy-D-manno-octulosonic acid kinase
MTTGDQPASGRSVKLISSGGFDVSEAWFRPDYWGDRAKPVASGGRGGAWFIDAEPDDLVLRHYRRGGMMARLAEKTYLFTGFDQTRSIAEFKLLQKLRELGLPVPEPVAAIAWRYRLCWCRAAILVKRIPGAVTFSDEAAYSDPENWKALGTLVRQFHDAGLNHVDLNCDNILLSQGQLYLIDFDRCRLETGTETQSGASWKESNLKRLKKSMVKRLSLSSNQIDRYWRTLSDAYAAS